MTVKDKGKTQAPATKPVTDENELAPEVMPDDDTAILTEAPDDWEFETVIEESPTHVIFNKIGDRFIGQFVGRVTVTPENPPDLDPSSKLYKAPFDLFHFRGQDGELYAVNTSGKLDKQFDELVKPNDWVRLTLIKTIASSKGNDFKDFRVEVRRR